MRIGIDSRMIDRRRHTGIARYIRNLLGNLLNTDDGNSYTVFLKLQDVDTIQTPGATRKIVHSPIYSLGEQFSFARAIARENLGVFHSPHYVLPLAYRGKTVVTVHDLIHLYYPSSRKANIFARLMLPATTRKAAKIIAVSHATKRDLINRLGIQSDRITVIHNGVEEAFQPIADRNLVDSFRARHGLPDRYVLYTGATKPHKNIPTLLKALAKVDENIPLVLTASKDFLEDQAIDECIEKLDLRSRTLFIGFLPEEEMPLLYNSATLLALPSLYEGFGFPVVEAMACGLPVVCSNVSSLPEVVGEAALTFAPTDSDEFAEKMSSLLASTELHKEFRAKGVERVRNFSWKKTAMETLRLYEEAAISHA